MYHVYLFETMKKVLLTVKYSILSPQIILWSSIDAGIPEQLLLKKKKKEKLQKPSTIVNLSSTTNSNKLGK